MLVVSARGARLKLTLAAEPCTEMVKLVEPPNPDRSNWKADWADAPMPVPLVVNEVNFGAMAGWPLAVSRTPAVFSGLPSVLMLKTTVLEATA